MTTKILPKNYKVTTWESLEPFYSELFNKPIESEKELINWLKQRSELESFLEEDLAWRYIKMNCDTTDEKLSKDFNFFVSEIEPHIAGYTNKLDKKLYNNSFLNKITSCEIKIIRKNLKNEIELFREENIPINAELQQEEQEYGKINSAMTISYNNKEYTLQQAANFLKNTNRLIREKIYLLINERRYNDHKILDDLLTSLITKRQKIAKNTGFKNYRDYQHQALARFDYSINDVINFQESIKTKTIPILDFIYKKRKKDLNLNILKPFDLEVDSQNKPPLEPFKDAKVLIEKAIQCFTAVRPKYGEYLSIMKDKSYLDLDSRKGKAPGGFNYPLYVSNIPFIYMNATGNLRDVETMMHEGGHAIHSFLSSNLTFMYNKQLPSEVAELASMSMELISMEHWNIFFSDKDELKRAKRSQLEGILKVLPWVATIDKFQHWLYLNINHTIEQRETAWTEIVSEFSSNELNWDGLEKFRNFQWQKQLHIFEVPFYYIEYAIAQLGAIAIWKNYKENPKEALNNYEKALSLGYTKPITEIYETAGIKFSFDEQYVNEIMDFVIKELHQLYD